MNIFAFVGASNSGKTLLIKKLISEFKSRGYSVGVIKHCPHGFDIAPQGKDSSIFVKENANPVVLVGPQEIVVSRKESSLPSLKMIASEYFEHIDIVLVEGGQHEKSLKKIEVLRQSLSEELKTNFNELIAVVSDFKLEMPKPIFNHHQISQIADFLEKNLATKSSGISLKIDGSPVRLNKFVQRIFKKIILGMISSLDRIKDNPENIVITLFSDKKKEEKKQR